MRRALVIALVVIYVVGVIAAAAYRAKCHRDRSGYITMDTGRRHQLYVAVPRDTCATP